ncbi:MAG: hypothetical protein ABI234_05285 [Ktedonobacteraceae bacterium]
MSEDKQEKPASTEANSPITPRNVVLEQALAYALEEKLAKEAWKQYKAIEPRLRNVLRILADS